MADEVGYQANSAEHGDSPKSFSIDVYGESKCVLIAVSGEAGLARDFRVRHGTAILPGGLELIGDVGGAAASLNPREPLQVFSHPASDRALTRVKTGIGFGR